MEAGFDELVGLSPGIWVVSPKIVVLSPTTNLEESLCDLSMEAQLDRLLPPLRLSL